jgi:GAF domain-containing protein
VPTLPSLFIGSSSEGKDVAEYLQASLDGHCQPEVWDQGVFEPTGETLGRLLRSAAEYDFAVLVLTPDDLLERRGRTSWAPRDNVLFELGLFLGGMGRDRVFMVCRQDHDLALPTDLFGVTTIRYQPWDRPNLRAQLNPAALAIREAIKTVGMRSADRRPTGSPPADPAAPSFRDVVRFIADLAGSIATGAAGVRLDIADPDRQRRWRGTLLAMLAEIFLHRAPDSYVAWLRPTAKSPDALTLFLHRNLPDDYDHYPFGRDEGLAGRAWSRGITAAHSAAMPHEWWKLREGCENLTYLCAPVGQPGASGGVLGVGSDSGFTVQDEDLDIVQLFAQLLATSMESGSTRAEERRLLRERVEALDNSLAPYSVSKSVHPQEVVLHNLLIVAVQELYPADPIIRALRPVDPEANPPSGLLRTGLSQIRATL